MVILKNPTLVSDTIISKQPFGMAEKDSKLYVGYQNKSDKKVCTAYFDNAGQIHAHPGPDVETSRGVSLHIYYDYLRAVFRVNDRSTSGREIQYALNLPTWEVTTLSCSGSGKAGTDQTPDLTSFGGKLYSFFKRGDHKIGYIWMDDKGGWSNAKPEDQAYIKIGSKDRWTDDSPAATADSKQLYVGHKTGSSGLQKIRLAISTDGSTWTGDDNIKVGNTEVQSKYGPGIALFKESLVLIYADKDKNLKQTSYKNGTWTTIESVGNLKSDKKPNLATFGSKAALSVVRDDKIHLYFLDVD